LIALRVGTVQDKPLGLIMAKERVKPRYSAAASHPGLKARYYGPTVTLALMPVVFG
jgi:hypothetical protein